MPASFQDVESFLKDFSVKLKIFGIIYRDNRPKNTQTLLNLEITPSSRKTIVEKLTATDYSEGPLDDNLYGIASMWVFGTKIKGVEIYIKISMGANGKNVICISFHEAASPMKYPFNKRKN